MEAPSNLRVAQVAGDSMPVLRRVVDIDLVLDRRLDIEVIRGERKQRDHVALVHRIEPAADALRMPDRTQGLLDHADRERLGTDTTVRDER